MQSMNRDSLVKINTLEESMLTQIECSKDQISVAMTEPEIKAKLDLFSDLLAINTFEGFNVAKQLLHGL